MFTTTMTVRLTRTLPLVAMLTAGACKGSTPEPTTEMSALPTAMNAAAPVLNSLNSAVPGLSQTQSIAAAGSLLGLAKTRMPADQYSQVATAIPGSDALVNEATRLGLPSNSLTGLSGVTDFLSKQGVSADQVSKMVPALGNLLKGKVSPEVLNSFMAALR